MRRALVVLSLLAAGPAAAAECGPQELMLKVSRLTELLEHQMQQPAGPRRAAMARMQAAMARHSTGVTDYQGVCTAYDDLLAQLGGPPGR